MITRYDGWKREKPGLGLWPHRGKVAIAGIGHSSVDWRWDGKDMSSTLGAKAILACERALADAGITKDQVDGLLCCPDSPIGGNTAGAAGRWGPRPYFAPPYDSEVGLSVVDNQWLIKNMGLGNVEFAPDKVPAIWDQVGMTSQAVGDAHCKVALLVFTASHFEGRLRRGGENSDAYAQGQRQWNAPWGNHGGNDFMNTFTFQQYCLKYGGTPSDVGPFVINQHRNGRMTPWGYYTNHAPGMITEEDYDTCRYVLKPLRLWDCERPVHAVTAYLFTTAERAEQMRQPPVYVLGHSQYTHPTRSTQPMLADMEAGTDLSAQLLFEASGLAPKDIDLLNANDGCSYMSQWWLEAFQFHGLKRGDALRFYAGDMRVEGPHPYFSSGGNLGNGATRTAMYTDTIEQLRSITGVLEGFDTSLRDKRKVTVKADVGFCGNAPPISGGWLALSKHPS